MYKNLPSTLKFLLKVVAFELLLLTLLRVAFFVAFKDYANDFTLMESLRSFFVGMRFDIQLLAIINLPILFIGYFFSKYILTAYILLTNLLMSVLYVINFAYYDFFKKNVDSSIIRYFYDIGEAFKMLEEGYPIYSSIFGVLIFGVVLFFIYLKLYPKAYSGYKETLSKKAKIITTTIFVILYIFAGYGKLEFYPWRWSEAFFSSNNFLSYLASNPVTYFVNTLKNQDVKYDTKEARKYYDEISELLGVEHKDAKSLTLVRKVTPKHTSELTLQKPNVIFVLGESTAYCRTSMSGNPLDPTPFLNSLAEEGITYERYFTPHPGTARSVFTAMTGLADIERMKTSSRNPMVVEQSMILNSLKDYEKFYFIGGSLSWGNVRGVISNVDGIHTREDSSYESPKNDVWGVSDADLLLEAHKTLKELNKPFFAFIQLAGNHAPWTIPENSHGFKKTESIDKDKLMNHSFDGKLEEFNGQNLMDYSVETFYKAFLKEKYSDNTIFIFVGDHGLPKKSKHMHPSAERFSLNSIHTPLIIHAPKLFGHQKISYPVSEVDIMATVAGLSGETYVNSTFGRDLLEEDFETKGHYAFSITNGNNPALMLISDEFIYRVKADGTNEELFKYYYEKEAQSVAEEYKEVTKKMREVCLGIYENTRYTRFNNSTNIVQERLKKIEGL